MTDSSLPAKLLAEFIGTFLLIFTIGCNVLSQTPVWAGVSIACVLMVSIYTFGGISGANFNPAVSFALGITKAIGGDAIGMDWSMVGAYSAVQFFAAAVAGLCYYAMFGQGFNLSPIDRFGVASAGLCELVYTLMLCFVVLNTAVAKTSQENQYYGLAIGFVIVAGAYGAGAVSGGCFNPAVAGGVAVGSLHHSSVGWFLVYTCFELIGASLAAALFKVVRPNEFISGSTPTMTSKLVAEFLGTFMLMFTVGLNVLAKSPAAAFSIAASLMCMIFALGGVSGAHFNPAVTFAIWCAKLTDEPLTIGDVSLYMAAQIGGAIVAAFTYAAVYSGETFPLGPGKGYTWTQLAIAEAMFTAVLCLAVLCTAVAEKTKTRQMFGLVIGSCVTVGGYAIGSISGGVLNPALACGIAASQLLNGGFFLKAFFYATFQFAGAAAAVFIVMETHGQYACSSSIMSDSPTINLVLPPQK